MKVVDLGEIDGPILLYGGPYSNRHATRALLAAAEDLGIPGDRRICTGDMVAYASAPVETAELVLAGTGCVVAGNVERQLGAGAEDCGCGFDEGGVCDLLSRSWYPVADRAVGPELRRVFAELPDAAVFRHAGARYGVIHGGVRDISRFIWPGDPAGVFAEERGAFAEEAGDVDVVVAGHSGMAFTRADWINAGVIGMPPHDGRRGGRFVVLEDGRAMIHRLDYDADAARLAMIGAGLDQGYHDALVTGFWPSESVLPRRLRRFSSL